ncbi:MAG: phage major capsid protein [Candidatus Thiodiazotropha lotti]|nr:phage major capsid protein [Candidatus Thiodiazotropha lotti]
MNVQTIRERRSNVVKKMKQLTQVAADEDRDLTDNESGKFNDYRSQLSSLDNQLERVTVIADAERSMSIDPNQPSQSMDGSFEEQCRNFSVTKAIAAHLEPGRVDAGREFEISQELAHRSGRNPSGIYVPHEVFQQRAITTAGSGGELIPTQHKGEMTIDLLRNSLQVAALGATTLPGLVGNQEIPRLTGSATPYWVAEHTDVTESEQTFDSITMDPKTVGAQVEYSRRMILNAVPSVENLIRKDLATVIASAIDDKAINGDGTGNTPTGVLNIAGIGDTSHGTDGGAPTWDNILNIINELAIDNALIGQLGWLTNSSVVKALRSTVKVASTDSQMIMSDPGSLAGYALRQSNHVVSNGTKGAGTNLSTIIFGNWSDLLIGYWSAVDILVNPYHTDVYAKGGVKINALQDCDIAVRHPESFSVATDLVTA